MNLKNYLLEYVSSGRGRHIKNMDNLPDEFRELVEFIEDLGYEEEDEFDVFTKDKVYFYRDSCGYPVNHNEKWLYVKNPAAVDEILFMDIEIRNNIVSNIIKYEIQSPNGARDINLKQALEYLRM